MPHGSFVNDLPTGYHYICLLSDDMHGQAIVQ
jgi:hypothetical protein